MSLTVLEVLENAQMNLHINAPVPINIIGRKQLSNAIKQLEENPDADEIFIEETK